jgi:hypothetical protein
MAGRGHYIRPTKRASVPSSVFALVCHPAHHTPDTMPGVTRATWHNAEIAHMTRRAGRWSVAAEFRTDSKEALRAWMDQRAWRRCLNWVIAPHMGEALTLAGWWDYAELRGVTHERRSSARGRQDSGGQTDHRVRVSQFVPNEPPGILCYSADGLRWRWVGERNYWPDGAAVAQHDQRGDGIPDGARCADRLVHRGNAAHDAQRLLARVRGLCDWWLRTARAPLGLTAGQLASGILRSYVRRGDLCTHTHEDVHRLERSAAHGGRASVWYVGRVGGGATHLAHAAREDGGCAARAIPGPVHHVDVSSMYPWLLRDRMYPTKVGPIYGEIRPDALADLARGTGVIARVTISTRVPEYPYRVADGVTYPVGTFTTTLAGPDILALAQQGSIDRVHCCATYRLGAPFAEGMRVLLSARDRAHAEGDEDARALSKLISVSLAGRLAQRTGGWVRYPALDEAGRWGQDWSISHSTAGMIRYRWICGACWVYDSEREPQGPHTAAFAYLTAYGRQHMAALRAALPPRSVYSQCIDGLYCSAEAIRSLSTSGSLTGTGPGRLRLTGTRDSAVFVGPRHYRWGSEWTLSGYHGATVDESRGLVSYSHRSPLFGERSLRAPDCTYTVYRTESLPSELERGKVGEDGWVIPPTVTGLSSRRTRER